MDKTTTIEDLKNKVKEFNEARDWDQFHDPKELSILISTEANELLQIFRFKDKKQMSELMNSNKKMEVEEELADVFNGVLRFAQMYNIDLSTVLIDKMEQTNKKYPIDKVKGCNKKYNEY